MKSFAVCALLLGYTAQAAVPLPDTDIWIADLVINDGSLKATEARRVTAHAGYDNQPAFIDESLIVYAGDAGGGQTDVYALDIETGERQSLAVTPEAEFSPTPAPGGGLSVVRVAADGTQQLWLLRDGASRYEQLFPLLEGIGYHAWLDDSHVALFMIVPGKEKAELHIANRVSGEVLIVSRDVGRSLQPWPGEPGSIAFVEPNQHGKRWVKRFDFGARTLTPLLPVQEGSEDFAILPDGRLLTASGTSLFVSAGDKWQRIARFEQLSGPITRLAVSPAGTRLALVVDE